jgi:RNA polymerase sigma factor (sigma-70 family)
MAEGQLGLVLRHLGRLVDAHRTETRSDGQLLKSFRDQHDECAFAALVQRHGPLVLTLCRRVLHDLHDAEDAFQATFLVLARKASSIRQPEALVGWLFQTARHIAAKALAETGKRRARERRVYDMRSRKSASEPSVQEVRAVLDDELPRLPEKYQAPLLLCYLEGKSHAEAARQLGWPVGTVKGRLARARELLRTRLVRRGLTLSAEAFAIVLAEDAAAATVPAALAASTVQAALLSATGKAISGAVSVKVAALADGAASALSLAKVKIGLVLLLIAGSVTAGLAAWAQQVPSEEPPAARLVAEPSLPAQAADQPNSPKNKEQARIDRYGDPLPAGAVARLGTVRFRHPFFVTGLAFTPDGKTLASACADGTARLWDPVTGRETKCFRREPNPIPGHGYVSFQGVAISPDGRRLIAVENNGTAYVWDLASGKELQGLKARSGFGLALSPDGKTLAVGEGADKAQQQFALWDLTTGKQMREVGATRRPVSALAFSPDGKVVAAGDCTPVGMVRPGVDSCACTIRLWDAATGRKRLEFKGHSGGVTAVAFARDGLTLVSTSHDATLRIWDPVTGQQVRKIQVPDDSFASPGDDPNRVKGVHYGGLLSVAYSADCRLLASGSYDGTVRIWEAATGRELHALRGHGREVASVAFSPDGKVLASGSWDHTIRLWDSASGKLLQPREGQDGPVDNLAVSADGRLAAVCCGSTIRLWSLATGQQLHVLPADTSGYSYQVAFSPDSSAVAAGSTDRMARVWDTATGRQVDRLADRPGAVVDVTLPPGRNSLLTAGPGPSLRFWDWNTGKEVRQIAIDGSWGLQMSLDGSLLAAADGRAVRLLDTATGKELRRFEPYPMAHFALSPDGSTLAMRLPQERRIHLWSVTTGEEVGALTDQDSSNGYAGRSLYVFSPDGRLLARVGKDRTIELWEVLTGKIRRRFRGHRTGAVFNDGVPLAFSPDGKTLLSGSNDTTVLIWDVARLQEELPTRLSETELKGLWRDLAEGDAGRADRAIWTFAATGGQCLPFLERQLRPTKIVEVERLTRLIADLDNDQFAIRNRATHELDRLGEQAEIVLRQAIKKRAPSLEALARMEDLLSRLRVRPLALELIRSLRAIEALEHIGTPDASELLQRMARGAADARLTQEAQTSLDRLAKRPVPAP